MRFRLQLFVLVALAVVAGLLLVEAVDVPVLLRPDHALAGAGGLAAPLGVLLLTVDAVLPVPATVVMFFLGARFGVLGGTVLSLVGSVGAALVAFALGRQSRRAASPAWRDDPRAELLLARWGPGAVVATRPVPVLAEAVAVLAGTSTMGWGTMAWLSAVGALPSALAFAFFGSLTTDVRAGLIALATSLAAGGVLWWIGSRARPAQGAVQGADAGHEGRAGLPR